MAQPQDYKVLQFKPGGWKDNHDNYWCDMALEGVSEPVRIAVKDPTQFQSGMTLYGTIDDATSKAGKPYLKFNRKQREDGEPTQQQLSGPGPAVAKKEWQPRDDSHIRAQWAIGQAVNYAQLLHDHDKEELRMAVIQGYAEDFFKMVDKVKGSSESTDLKPGAALSTTTTAGSQSGYEKAKQAHQTLKAKQPVKEEEDPEFASMLAKGFEADGIDLDEIPF